MCGRCCWITTVMVVKTVRAPKGLVDPVSSQKIPRQGASTVFFFVKTMIKAAAATSSAEVLCSSSPKSIITIIIMILRVIFKRYHRSWNCCRTFFHNNQSLHRALTRSKVNFLIFLIFNNACIHWEQVTATSCEKIGSKSTFSSKVDQSANAAQWPLLTSKLCRLIDRLIAISQSVGQSIGIKWQSITPWKETHTCVANLAILRGSNDWLSNLFKINQMTQNQQ